MGFELIVLVLAIVVNHSNASRDESACSFMSGTETNWCLGPLENIQCNAPVFDDDRKCMNKNETLAILDELQASDLAQKKTKYKKRMTRTKAMVIDKFEDNQSSTCLTRKEETTEGQKSLEVR